MSPADYHLFRTFHCQEIYHGLAALLDLKENRQDCSSITINSLMYNTVFLNLRTKNTKTFLVLSSLPRVVSVAESGQDYIFLDGMMSIAGLPPELNSLVLINTPGWRETL